MKQSPRRGGEGKSALEGEGALHPLRWRDWGGWAGNLESQKEFKGTQGIVSHSWNQPEWSQRHSHFYGRGRQTWWEWREWKGFRSTVVGNVDGVEKKQIENVTNQQQRSASVHFSGWVSAVCQVKVDKMVPSELTAELETQVIGHNDRVSYWSIYAVRSHRCDPKVRLEEGTVGKGKRGRKDFRSRWQLSQTMFRAWALSGRWESHLSIKYSQGRKYQNQRLLRREQGRGLQSTCFRITWMRTVQMPRPQDSAF